MPSPIEHYALVGDCETAALVARDGSIDWLCWPRFDSPACFAALLGAPEHGRWRVAPVGETTTVSRRYRDETLILETTFETEQGAVTVIDFMPPRTAQSDLVRIVVGVRGSVDVRTELVIRPEYGSAVPWVTRLDDGTSHGVLRAIAGPAMLTLRTDVALHGESMTTVGDITVREGDAHWFVLTHSPSHLPLPEVIDPHQALVDTEAFWREWTGRCTYTGPWRDAVVRSLITLKGLTYRPTGGVVAAPTTSLPEQLGGTRNWDYRYCWLRDATLTLLALMDAGYYEEAGAWRDWLLRAAAGSPSQLQIMYGIAGERNLVEWTVPWLPGYEGAAPVRIGNAAHAQTQLDVYGEVLEALYLARQGGLPASAESWQLEKALVDYVSRIWDRPDEGIWEVRGGPQHFVHSKVMAWVAVDRAIRSAEEFSLAAPLDDWRTLRATIHADVCARGFDASSGSFVQAYGSTQLDASLLLIPTVGFLPHHDPRVLGTIAAIERHLVVDGFVLRYDSSRTADGLPPGEGAFLACSFWLADNYALCGRHEEARALFERLLALRNDVGLLAEEFDSHAGRLVGNFPQAFSHLSLIGTAMNLSHPGDAQTAPAVQRSTADMSATPER